MRPGHVSSVNSANGPGKRPLSRKLYVMAYIDLGPDELRALLRIAAAVQRDGRAVTLELITAARAEGATEIEVHDTVLIPAMFCMINRYVDGLGTFAPTDPSRYEATVPAIVAHGYATAGQAG